MFLENRVYQGSSGRVYPLPFIDRIAESAVEVSWDAIHLENESIRLMVLPEIGGRIHVGLDKTNDYDFFYRQNVIKPALVGLAGPWISGGVEFNWPQHHRPATYMPVATEIEQHRDGSVTVWCSDHDPMQRMKGMHGICLRPGSCVVELKVRLYNRTPYTQTFLWWANMAARVHEQYQSFFPPDVRYVADHAKRAITSFPRSDRPYYGIDYADRARRGVPEEDQPGQNRPDGSYAPDDLSRYANIPVPTSYMITSTAEDFFGGYDHNAKAGVLHFADHRIAPGKKQWTWGNHEFGYAWDRSLTDSDGPYIELMAGVYTDNQPDFSFLAPGETKTFSQYWYPLRRIGPPQAANLDFAVTLNHQSKTVRIGVQTTEDTADLVVSLLGDGSTLMRWTRNVQSSDPLLLEYSLLDSTQDAEIAVTVEAAGKRSLRYAPTEVVSGPLPSVAKEPPAPENVPSIEELYLTGLHLDQYRHATRRPELYWEEALRRNPSDSRSNIALGKWHLERGEFELASARLNVAKDRLTALNPNPRDSEVFYLLGLVYRFQGRDAESYDAFAKATWSNAWKAPAHYALAQAAAAAGEWNRSLNHCRQSLICNADSLNSRNLSVIALRELGEDIAADALLDEARRLDPLDQWSRHLAGVAHPASGQVLLDLVWDYASCGRNQIAITLLAEADLNYADGTAPILRYTLGYLLFRTGRTAEGAAAWRRAAAAAADYCFPHRLEEAVILQFVIERSHDDARARYYLGNLLYDRRRYEEAIDLWQQASMLDPSFPTAHRNLGIALFNVRDDTAGAVAAFDRAHAADPSDGRIVYERDQLWKRIGVSPKQRLAELMSQHTIVAARDDLSVELATLHNQTDHPEQALALLMQRCFHPWEGGEGLVLGQFVRSRLLLARKTLTLDQTNTAIEHLQAALHPPQSLGEARHLLANKSDIHYLLGVACEQAGNHAEAERWWQDAARESGDFQQMSVLAVSDMTYWRGAALRKLGREQEANQVFRAIATFADELEKQEPNVDYFATSLPAMLLFQDDLKQRNLIHVAYLRAQAACGLHGAAASVPLLQALIATDSHHAGASDLLREANAELHASSRR